MTHDPETTDRRRKAAIAGHSDDPEGARSLLHDPAGTVRAAALGALARLGRLEVADVERGLADPDPAVRRRAAVEGRNLDVDLVAGLDDPDHLVVEAVAWALGERPSASPATIAALSGVVTTHADPLARESAVAALGALGDDAGLPAVLAATTDKPAIRRRAVLALAAFEGEEVDAALHRALDDRDWQVRQAAEDLLA